MAQAQYETIINLQQLVKLTKSDNLSMHHFKVQRWFYYHHYILLGHTWVNQGCEIIQFTGNPYTAFGLTGVGIARKEWHSGAQFQKDINKGLYMIYNTAYPRNSEDIARAWSRWLGREGDRRYYVSANNCENLVTYILTGVSHSEQWTVAGFYRRAFMDTIDVVICEWKDTLLKGNGSFVTSSLLRHHMNIFATEISEKLKTRSWISQLKARIRTMFQKSPKLIVPDVLMKFIVKFGEEYRIQPDEILHNDRLMYDVTIQFLELCVKTVGYSFLFSLTLEIFSIMDIIKFWYYKEEDKIQSPVFKRELIKRVFAMSCAILGTVLVCLFGFLFSTSWKSPYVLGYLMNIFCRIVGSIIGGAAVDWIRND